MNAGKWTLTLAAALSLTGMATAQQDDAAAVSDVATREAAITEQLRAAEARLAEAAREVAELSTRNLPDVRRIERNVIVFDDRPRLGVSINGDDGSDPVEGVTVLAVTPGTAAADAGLRAGDVLTSINGEALAADDSDAANRRLLDFMRGVEEGDKLDVEYLRDGNVGTVVVEPRRVDSGFAFAPGARSFSLPDMPRIAPRAGQGYAVQFAFAGRGWADMELVELSEGLGRYFGTDEGLLVVSAPGGDGLQLQDGDVIQAIDGRKPSSVRHALRILGSYQAGEKLSLEIYRDRKSRTLEITMPDDRQGGLLTPRAPLPPRAAMAPSPAAPRP